MAVVPCFERVWRNVNVREFFKASVILTPGTLFVGCEPQFVLHVQGIRQIRQISSRGHKSCFGGPLSQLRVREMWTRKTRYGWFVCVLRRSLYCRSKSLKIVILLCLFIDDRWKSFYYPWTSIGSIVLLCFFIKHIWNSLYYHSKSPNIYENHCTIVL